MGLVTHGGLGVLQTYRGCPYTCSFCEWGTMESPKRVRTAEHLAEEFNAMANAQVTGALLVDAGLNLNGRAFDQLEIAAERTGFFHNRKLICEVYPAKVTDQHIRFLSSVGNPLVGVGLQSFDNEVLAHVERSFDEQRFEDNMARLTNVSRVAIEIIMGLPGDSPEQFRRSFHRARTFPCALRVYHCCVLPSALMVRSPAEHALDYDPVTLKMRSCLGWSREAMLRECEFLNQQAQSNHGQVGDYFWVFSAPKVTEATPQRKITNL
jgi:histone acetyltransferase (RNA polymerase elongator complex component)